MDDSTKNYRKGELSELGPYKGSYTLKVAGVDGTESKWLSINEEELADIRGILTDDAVNTALNILNRAGFVSKVYGPEDVHEVLYQYVADNNVDALTYRDEITQHIMEGDDWEGILDTGDSMDYIWGMIDGTRNDHPEWFPTEPEQPQGFQWILTPILDEDDNDPVIEIRHISEPVATNVGSYAAAAEWIADYERER